MGNKKKSKGIAAWLNGTKGQRFFNFAYSIGAAVVIWGALFKILHLQGGNTLLTIGMATEVLMFVLTAFDKPPKEYAWEDVFPALDPDNVSTTDTVGVQAYPQGVGYAGAFAASMSGEGTFTGTDFGAQTTGGGGMAPGAMTAGGASHPSMVYTDDDFDDYIGIPDEIDTGEEIEETVLQSGKKKNGRIIRSSGTNMELDQEDIAEFHESIAKMAAAAEQLSQMAELTTATKDYLSELSGISTQMAQLQQTTAELNQVSGVLLDSYKTITDNSENISENSTGYVERMADLNKNLGGLNTIYEIQLKSISSQLESIDRVNRGLKDIRDMYEKSARESSRYCEETEKMARYMKQLNSVYEKMLTAMTINMYNPMMGAANAPQNGSAGAEGGFNPFEASERFNETGKETND